MSLEIICLFSNLVSLVIKRLTNSEVREERVSKSLKIGRKNSTVWWIGTGVFLKKSQTKGLACHYRN